jgi:hypothetical protein
MNFILFFHMYIKNYFIYFIICQIEHIVKLNKQLTTFVKMTNGF